MSQPAMGKNFPGERPPLLLLCSVRSFNPSASCLSRLPGASFCLGSHADPGFPTPLWGWDVQCELSPAAFPLHGEAALVDVYGLGLIWLSTGINGFEGEGLPGGPGKTTLRIPLAMWGTSVWSLVWEDPTCWGQLTSMCSTTREATAMRSWASQRESNPHSLQIEGVCSQQWRPSTAKNRQIHLLKRKLIGRFGAMHETVISCPRSS